MRHGSLFDGAGGMRIGLEQAGFQTAWTVEILNGQDITKLDPHKFERVNIISGGPPCQRGSLLSSFHNNRTKITLWKEMLSFIQILRPQWVLVENVLGFKQEMLYWSQELQQLGYGCAGQCISSRHWLPQIRTRIFLIARLETEGVALWNYLYSNVQRGEIRSGRCEEGEQSQFFLGSCAECLRGGIFARVSARKIAFVGAGNAVSIPVAKWLGERIIEAESKLT